MKQRLTGREKETIFICNEVDKMGYYSTYNKAKQRHVEKRLGIQPSNFLDCGGREYQVPKSYLKLIPPRKLSTEQMRRLADRMREINLQRKLTEIVRMVLQVLVRSKPGRSQVRPGYTQ